MCTRLLPLFVLSSLFSQTLPFAAAEIRLGVIESDPQLVAVCSFAVKRAHEEGLLKESVTLVNASGCEGEGTANSAKLFFEQNVAGIVASRCSDETVEIARLGYFENIPVLNRVGTSSFANDQDPTLVDTSLTSLLGFCMAIKELMNYHKYKSLTLVGPSTSIHGETVALHDTLKNLLENDPDVPVGVKVIEFYDKMPREDFLSNVDLNSRLIIFAGDRRSTNNFFNKMDLTAAVESGFVIVMVCENFPADCTSEIKSTIKSTKTFVLTFHDVDSKIAVDELRKQFQDLDSVRLHELSTIYSYGRFQESSADALAMYDSCYAFSYGSSLTAASNGLLFANNLKSKNYKTLNRQLTFDGSPAVLRSYAFFQIDDSTGEFTVWGELKATATLSCAPSEFTACFQLELSVNNSALTTSPADLSECAFTGSGCRSYLWLFIVGGVVAAVALVAAAFYCYRRRQRLEIYRLHWKLPSKSFKIIDKPTGGKSNSGGKFLNKKRNVNSYVLIGSTKAEFTELTQRGKLEFSKDELELLTELKKASHDNIAKFLGVHYNEGPRFLVMQTFVERATLDDILKNIDNAEKKYESKDPTEMLEETENDAHDEELSVDMIFKSGFVHDIIKGLTYLHRTIGYHGWLSVHTCMIDANWVLKLTNFGLGRLVHRFNETGQLVCESIPLSHYVSIAPEHLNDCQYGSVYPLGSQEGDIYSLGIVACQILFDSDPYTDSALLTQEVLKKISNGALTPKIPQTSSQFEESLKDLVSPCLVGVNARPNIRSVSDCFNKVFHKSRGNLVDQMLARNAQYANQLEGTVNQRTGMLQEAQMMSYKLLCELLPKSVADAMRMGIRVEPRSYESATVLFCQICYFQAFLAQSTAEQVGQRSYPLPQQRLHAIRPRH
ncbi:hypothetical protein L596_014945 [Steinernema carpocapsae]|uniref:guanylate cyclase n=1 Tax=Steinernema carpocapsae TaxID=34508 RepID=A0A4U5NDG2_STECR|nr:hypothetical protein L596_014945 [Steinernema carpocapsae]